MELPYNLDAEQAFLAALLIDNGIYLSICGSLKPEHFYDSLHGRIFEMCGLLIERGQIADPITLLDRFSEDKTFKEIDGKRYLADLVSSVITIYNGKEYAEKIVELYKRRRVSILARELMARMNDGSISDFEPVVGSYINELSAAIVNDRKLFTKHDAIQEIIFNMNKEPDFVATGLNGLDQMLGGGLFPKKLYGIGARKKAGKTTLLGTISQNINAAGVKHLFIAMEMDAEEIEIRNLSREMKIKPLTIMLGKRAHYPVDSGIIVEQMGSIPNNTFYEARPGISIDEIETKVLYYKHHYGIKGTIIDYWQLITGGDSNNSEARRLDDVAQRLLNLAKRLGIWILCATQLNQEGNTRNGEGLKLACDAYLDLKRLDLMDSAGKQSQNVMLELTDCRYMPYAKLGDEVTPGLIFEEFGPHFRDF